MTAVATPSSSQSGFDVMLGNPPWERVKLQEKEWFSTRNEAIATASNAAKRKKLINALKTEDPPMHEAFLEARRTAEGNSHYLRYSGRYPLCGRGDVNTYTVFTELIRDSLSPRGRSGCIVPSGIATDDTTKFFFQSIVERQNLVSLYDFENAAPIFVGVHRSYKFCALTLGGDAWHWTNAEFAFFLHHTEELDDDNRVFTLTAEDIALVNPNTRTCPIFRTKRDVEITKGIYRRVPVLVDESKGESGNPWGVKFNRMFDMSNDSHLFHTREDLEADGWTLEGNVFVKGDKRMLPLYEAKMMHHYDDRWSHAEEPTPISHQNPGAVAIPRNWVNATEIQSPDILFPSIAYRWIARSTDARTLIATLLHECGVGNSAPLVQLNSCSCDNSLILLAAINTFATDYVTRQKLGGANLTFGTFKQIPVCAPGLIPLDTKQTISMRLRELVNTSTNWSPQLTYRYSMGRRFQIRCELDAAFFHLYGIERDDVDYIMDTFPIVNKKDVAKYDTYHTKDRILQIYDEMTECMANGTEWESPLDPPPGDPRAAWTEEELELWRRGEGDHLIEKYKLLDEETC